MPASALKQTIIARPQRMMSRIVTTSRPLTISSAPRIQRRASSQSWCRTTTSRAAIPRTAPMTTSAKMICGSFASTAYSWCWPGPSAATARHARRVVEAHIEGRRDERVEADAHEVVARRADDLGAHVRAATAVDATRRLAQDERVGVVADVVVVDAGEAVLRDRSVGRALGGVRFQCRGR